MSYSKKQRQIDFVLKNITNVLEREKIEYLKDEKNLKISFSVNKCLKADFVFKINSEKMLVSIISKIPYIVKQDKIEDLAAAICFINNFTANGCFDFDINTGEILFRMTNGFLESLIGEEAYEYMIDCSVNMLIEYSEQLILLARGLISLDEFVDRNGI